MWSVPPGASSGAELAITWPVMRATVAVKPGAVAVAVTVTCCEVARGVHVPE